MNKDRKIFRNNDLAEILTDGCNYYSSLDNSLICSEVHNVITETKKVNLFDINEPLKTKQLIIDRILIGHTITNLICIGYQINGDSEWLSKSDIQIWNFCHDLFN
jgi:hypothetical protein